MKYCCRCQKNVNVNRTTVNIHIADIWNDHCEECGNFVDSGFDHIEILQIDDLNKTKKETEPNA